MWKNVSGLSRQKQNQKETLDGFIDKMIQIAKEVEENPEVVQEAPHTTVIKRLDETMAARKPVLTLWKASSCTSLIRITKRTRCGGLFFVWRICAEVVKKMLKIYIFCFITV